MQRLTLYSLGMAAAAGAAALAAVVVMRGLLSFV
jgi:hypothetical protein